MPKTQQHNPVVDMVQYQLDASIQLADVVFSGTEKIDRAVLDVTHQAVDSQLKLVRAIANMRDPSRMADLQQALSDRPEKAMHCQQQIMSAVVEMQAEFGRSVRDYMDRVSHTAADQVESAQHQATAGLSQPSEAMVNPFTGMMGVWGQAFREVNRFATQNMTVARSNVETAANFARDAVSRTVEHVVEEVEHPHAHKRTTANKKK